MELPSAPDLVEPVIGFRSWRLVGGELKSPYVDVYWRERVMHAVCHDPRRASGADDDHPAPAANCGCGIYALFEPPRGLATPIDAVGIVTLWGRMQVHAGGVRAEHARIEALGVDIGWRGARNETARAIAARLGIDVLARGDLGELCFLYGTALPASLIPGDRRG